MAKRIAFFIGQILHDYQNDIIRGVSQEANRAGYRVEIFSNFGTYGENYLHAEGEKNIMNLPNLEEYDAIIVAPDTYDLVGMYEALSEKILTQVDCPVVSLRCEDSNFYNVLIDDEQAMATMVEHLITVHGMKRICFMTGRMDLVDARRRLQGYRKAMEAHNLMVTDHMIFEGDYWREKGELAVDWFLSGGEYPEAIVCANDFMAISVCEALQGRGIRIPKDICVTGFDHIDEAKYYTPSLTSVIVQSEAMGKAAVGILRNLFEGRKQEQYVYVPVGISYGGSCGCVQYDNNNSIRELYREKEYLKSSIMLNAYANVDMESCNTMGELFQTAYKYSYHFEYQSLYICLCNRAETEDGELSNEEKYTERVSLRAVMRKGRECYTCDEEFDRNQILPDKYRKTNDTIYCYPLHYKNHCMGYVVMETQEPKTLKQYFVTWMLALSNYLDKVYIYQENQNLLQFRQQSMLDELTGLYNRREYERILQRKHAIATVMPKGFFIISCDMDGLKMINDTYGHLEGDKALRAFADILKSVECEEICCSRMGGDEFGICYNTAQRVDVNNLVEAIRTKIDEYNAKNNNPYMLSASIGYAYCSGKSALLGCIAKADESMYREKATKKYARVNMAKRGDQ